MNEVQENVVDVRLQLDQHRYVICFNGAEVGFSQFVDDGNKRIFTHTEVSPDYGGQGLGVKLVSRAVQNTIDEGKIVVPVCPFVASYLKRHPNLSQHSAKPTPETFALISRLL